MDPGQFKKKDLAVQQKVTGISNRLTKVVSRWEGIVATVLGEAASIETYDPYFNIDLDVYFQGNLLPSNDRREQLGNPGGFETSPINPTDRFLLEDLPVSINYNEVTRINMLLKRVETQSWVFRLETTNILYRIEKGKVLFSEGGWFENLGKKLLNVSDGFWNNLKEATRFSMDYYLNSLGAAVYREDLLFYQFSSSRFLQSLCSFLFALNKRFEPSGRLLLENIKTLRVLPGEFMARFESLIRPDVEIPKERKFEIAKLLAKSAVAL
jgi:hypothetical protein